MSDALAIAAVTETLRAVLGEAVRRVVPGAEATSRHPDAAHPGPALNVFLYRTDVDAAWRNTDPAGTHPGETHRPALALALHYLLSAHVAPGDDSTVPERLIGAAMSALHDRPELRAEDLRAAAGFSDLHRQREPVKLTPSTPTADEMCRLWRSLGGGYRLSVAYEARVVLIDSSAPGRTPPPVLRRGEAGAGPVAAPTAMPPWPVLESVRPSVAVPGSDIVLSGSGLAGGTPSVRLTHGLLAGPPVVLAARAESAGAVRATLGEDLAAGCWSAVVVLTAANGGERTTRPRTLRVAPRVTSPLPLTVGRDAEGAAVLEVRCAPAVHPEQRVELLVGSRPVAAEPFTRATGTLRFRLASGAPGRYPLRLRVDGVDSPLADGDTGLFDADRAVVIT
ncbi:Pvc16 family protein [Streptomyces sp. NPDC007945]|uniref:Pvc16 family protein n=1 Tax=Streptomyces sp. NPDC007945 TaxID=3364797 RepID=UPI0036EF1501